jgi:hypothetical protein
MTETEETKFQASFSSSPYEDLLINIKILAFMLDKYNLIPLYSDKRYVDLMSFYAIGE